MRYAGNIRLDMMDRDKGKLHFAYFEDLQEWKEDAPLTYKVFDTSDGVLVEKIDFLVYRVTFGERAGHLRIERSSKVVPPPHAIGPDEKFIGPMFDEFRHALLSDLQSEAEALPLHSRRDREGGRISFALSAYTNRILIGVRTGFAYYLDLRMNRKILIGVFEANSRVNNPFDGPFDQLPDNFVKAMSCATRSWRSSPRSTGKIDRVGGSFDGSGRYLIGPYATYRTEDQLYPFHYCATSKSVPSENYYQCFVVEQEYGGDPVPLPLKAKCNADANAEADKRSAAPGEARLRRARWPQCLMQSWPMRGRTSAARGAAMAASKFANYLVPDNRHGDDGSA